MAYIKNANIDLININLYVFLILGRPTVGTDPEPWVNLNDPASGAFDPGTEVPEHALKIYKTDQQFKYLLFCRFSEHVLEPLYHRQKRHLPGHSG